MENENNGAALMEAMEGIPNEEVVAEPIIEEQAPVQEQIAPAPQMPQFDPSLLVGALDNVHSRLDSMQPQQQEVQPTEEDIIMKELASKMGLDKMQEENAALKQMLEQTKGQTEQMTQYIEQQQIASTQDSILSKYEGTTKEMVYAKLDEIAQTRGQAFAESLNNSEGWEFLLSTAIQKPASSPDPIVSTESGNTDFSTSAVERVNAGNKQQGDIGSILASFV